MASNKLQIKDREDLSLSLEIDPLNKYNFSSSEKDYIRYYLQYNDLYIVTKLMIMNGYIQENDDNSVDPFTDLAVYLMNEDIQDEINRLEFAYYKERTQRKVMTYDEIGAYLSSLIAGQTIPFKDKLNSAGKLEAMKLLISWYEKREEIYAQDDNDTLDISLDEQLHELSVESIKHLLSNLDKNKSKKIKGKDFDKMDNKELIKTLNNINNSK